MLLFFSRSSPFELPRLGCSLIHDAEPHDEDERAHDRRPRFSTPHLVQHVAERDDGQGAAEGQYQEVGHCGSLEELKKPRPSPPDEQEQDAGEGSAGHHDVARTCVRFHHEARTGG